MSKYVSLHNHTSYSIGQALTSPEELFDRTKEFGQTAVGVTDTDTMAGMWDCLKISKDTGVKLIAGCEFNFVEDLRDANDTRLTKLVLLAKNHKGYKNMLALRKYGFDNMSVHFKKANSRIDWKLLSKYSDGLICLSGDGNGYLPQLIMSDRFDKAKADAKKFVNIFGDDFALELQPHNLQIRSNPYSGDIDQRKINLAMKKIHEELDIKCIVSTCSYYLEKEHHDSQDVLLAISSGQPVFSGQRLKFDKHEFYVKSEEEIRSYFARHKKTWPQEFVDSLIDNTSILSDRCEFPEWIDPKFSNPSGKELPEFPIEDRSDYHGFCLWKELYPENSLPDDVLYYRFLVELGLEEKLDNGKLDKSMIGEYRKQIAEELDVLEYHGFSSYMLIVWDYINWCVRNDIPVGPGRGCLTGDTEVLTDSGFVRLDSVNVGDSVFTHQGRVRGVYNKFAYDIDEVGLKIGTDYSFNDISLTKDHKVFASVCSETEQYTRMKRNGSASLSKVKRWDKPEKPSWFKAEDLKLGDYIFMPFPTRENVGKIWGGKCNFDLSQRSFKPFDSKVTDDKIIHKIPLDNEFSIRTVSKETCLDRGVIQRVLRGKKVKKDSLDKVSDYLASVSELSVDDWVSLDNTYEKTTSRYLKKDNELLYVIGRWVGDGWTEHNPAKGYSTGFAFNSSDEIGISRIKSYFESNGFDVARYDSNNKNLVQLIVKGQLLFNFFSYICKDYKQSSSTKHLPVFFRRFDEDQLRSMLHGLCDSDGHVEISKDYKRENFDTTSKRLALEFKEALLYLGIPSSINTRSEYKRDKYTCSESYKVRFKGLKLEKSSSNLINDEGYFCKIRSLEEVHLDSVYDISVEDDVSYMTANYAVHNSVGGCFTAFLIGIHEADPFKYGLIFSRFHNKEKTSFPDIDTDFSPAGRDKLHAYIRGKYGDEYVAHVSNVNTITPKVYARDISRVFEFGDDGRSVAAEIGDDIADSISSEYSRVTTALKQAPLFMEYAKQYPELSKHAILGGKARAWSTHAAGLIIGKRPLHEIVPVRRDPHGAACLEYEKERSEDNGLVKMDTLGLETLDIIKRTYSLIKEVGKTPPPLPFDYDQYDQKTYDLISEGDTFCVFQLTGVAAPVCKMLKPKSVEDIALVTALIRPAAKAIINDFMKVRSGEKELELMHPTLERALKPTYGFGLYEECLMFIAADVAGWDLHKADGLRKMTKSKGKYPEKVAKLREEFIEDAQKNKNVEKEDATRIWDEIIAGFGGYGFNRSLHFSELVDIYTNEGQFIEARPIQDVKAGEFVRSRDEQTKEDIYIEVIDNHDHGELELVEVELDSGEKVKCTMNHKFRTIETGEMLPLHKILKDGLSIVVEDVKNVSGI